MQYRRSTGEVIWNEKEQYRLAAAQKLPPPSDIDEEGVAEGKRKLRIHYSKERNQRVVALKKQAILAQTGRLVCEACDFEFAAVYGPLGDGYAECHHKVPLAELEEDHRTRLSELAIICANCHRMLHRGKRCMAVESLRAIVQVRRNQGDPT